MGKIIKLVSALDAWGTPEFESALKLEVQSVELEQLPLQAGLSQTSYVCDSGITVLILNVTESKCDIVANTGIFYAGIIAGSCCDNDPTPVCEQTEYCEVRFNIDKLTAETTITLLNN